MAKRNYYEVIVGNIGRVYEGNQKSEARATFRSYVWDSKNNRGRAAGEIVDFYLNGEITETFDPNDQTPKPKKEKPNPIPAEIWVMAYHTSNILGSISHVSSEEKFYTSKEACQKAIDEMKMWIGSGDRSQYRPLKLIRA